MQEPPDKLFCEYCGAKLPPRVRRGRRRRFCNDACRSMAAFRSWYDDPEKRKEHNAKQRAYYHKHKERQTDSRLRKTYGLSLAAVHEMERRQNGVCALCGNKPPAGKFHVDHDHVTSKIRGLLCPQCNTCLIELHPAMWYLQAYRYLKRHENRSRT